MESKLNPEPISAELANDLLEGADAIAEYLYGSRTLRRKIYHLAQKSKLPLFRLGSVLCARKSVLMNYILGQERIFFALLKETDNCRKDSLYRPDDIQ